MTTLPYFLYSIGMFSIKEDKSDKGGILRGIFLPGCTPEMRIPLLDKIQDETLCFNLSVLLW